MKGLPELVIGDLKVKRPVIQGGMGVGVSLGQLAGAVAKEGGVGIISTAQIGFREPDFETNTRAANIRAIGSEFQRARETAPDGVIGFNIMVALKDYDEHVKAAVDAGADLIVSGAGLPIELPGLVEGSSTKIAPIVSTEKSAKVILKYWDKKFSRKRGYQIMDKIRQLQDMINESNRIVFFGGAGVSTESNIPDFRSADGLYKQKYRYSPEQIVSHSFFMQHTEEFYDFYKEKMMFLDAKPNKAHLKLAELEAAGKLTAVITQNIDGLHQAAGSKNVLELHGSIHRNYCMRCKKQYSARFVKESKGIPTCDCGGTIRPDVVLYEEGLDNQIIQKSIRAISEADMLIIGGTSLVVYPAAGFIDYFHGKYLVLINKDTTARDVGATLTIHEPIGEVLDRIHV